jgi:hypothetical protein
LINSINPDSLPASFQVTLNTPAGYCAVARLKQQPGVYQVTLDSPTKLLTSS